MTATIRTVGGAAAASIDEKTIGGIEKLGGISDGMMTKRGMIGANGETLGTSAREKKTKAKVVIVRTIGINAKTIGTEEMIVNVKAVGTIVKVEKVGMIVKIETIGTIVKTKTVGAIVKTEKAIGTDGETTVMTVGVRGRGRRRRERVESSPTPSPPPAPMLDSHQAGEWICRCGALNFKRRLNCYRQHCGAQRSDAVSVQGNTPLQAYTKEDVPRLAAYSAQLYATNVQERAMYIKYYTDYYNQQIAAAPQLSDLDRVNAAAAVAQSAINQMQARNPVTTPPNGVDGRMYPVPDVSTYLYDESSGYYYDSTTGLYYDPNTQYYFNNQINQYLYWDMTKFTYVLASTLQNTTQTASTAATVSTEAQPAPSGDAPAVEEKKKQGDKSDKVKVAKKIAKDMERWAKTLNQKKEMAKTGLAPESINGPHGPSFGSADIGYSVLEQRVPVNSAPVIVQPPQPPPTLVPSYGGGSDSSGDESESILDWAKLACLLCKRQFPSREVMEKHQLMSDLHRQNLEVLRGTKNSIDKRDGSYRDRAAERRMKYGEDNAPVLRTVRSDPPTASIPQAIGEENIGNKLLKKMGWSAGQGLGKEGQGRVGPVEASTGGLGRKRGIYTAGPGETYRGCVKKLTMARYQDLVGSESNT